MTVRITDRQLLEQLVGADESVTVEGPDGVAVGRFTPLPLPPGISEEEMLRRLNDPTPGYTTEQVLAHLRSL